jgi:precorrin isomerase
VNIVVMERAPTVVPRVRKIASAQKVNLAVVLPNDVPEFVLGNHARFMETAHQVNIVVMERAPTVVPRVRKIASAQKVNLAVVLPNDAREFVLGNHACFMETAHQVKIAAMENVP